MRIRLLVVLAALLVAAPAAASTSSSSPPDVRARAWLVQNGATGEILAERNAAARVPIASITKLMTVLVALEHAGADDVVTVAPVAASVGESSVQLRAGERITVRDLVEAALIQSANDAAYALAAHVGKGSVDRFVGMMNAKARKLGLTDTHFVRPDGLDVDGHVSSARDVTKLGRVAMQRPLIREIVRLQAADAAGRRVATWNDLLATFPGLIGVKTGHTRAAGWSQVAAARGHGFTIYASILGSATRAERNADLAKLLAWGMSRYRVVQLVDGRRAYASATLPYGLGAVRLVAARPLAKVVHVERPLVERVVAPDAVTLPVRRGQQLGHVRVYVGGELVGSRPLVAERTVERPGARERVGWYAGRMLRNAWEAVA